jgi:hypothetical protein
MPWFAAMPAGFRPPVIAPALIDAVDYGCLQFSFAVKRPVERFFACFIVAGFEPASPFRVDRV